MEAIADEVKFERYPAYKDSGVEWLGEVPEHWDLSRLGSRFNERRTKVSDKDFEPLSVTKQGILPQIDSAAKSNDGDNRKLVKAGDFVINSRSDRKGSSGIAKIDGSVSLINIVMEPVDIDSTFCNYLLKSYNFIEEFYRMGHGIVADLWTTRYDEMKAITIAIPSLIEQTAIAKFLDKKAAQMDLTITQKEKQIELLNERRQILISKAVSQGLNPDAPMKNSGVELIGWVPKDWIFAKLGHYIDILSGFAFPSASFSIDSGVKLLRGINVGVNAIRWDDTVYWVKCHNKELAPYFLKENDIIFGMDRPLIASGMRVATVSKGDLPCLLLQRVTRIRPLKGLELKYLKMILSSKLFMDYFNPILSGVSVPHISPSQIQSFKIGIPDKVTQVEILSYIETQTTQTDTAIAIKRQEIEKLKEYKSTLINSAVTGKIKIS